MYFLGKKWDFLDFLHFLNENCGKINLFHGKKNVNTHILNPFPVNREIHIEKFRLLSKSDRPNGQGLLELQGLSTPIYGEKLLGAYAHFLT